MRDYLGCYDRGDAKAPRPHFAGTRFETRKCPRALVIKNPEVAHLIAIYNQLPDGRPSGTYGPERLSAVAVQALSIIDAARAYRLEQQAEELERERDRKKHVPR